MKSELQILYDCLDYFEYHNKNLTNKQMDKIDLIRYIVLAWEHKGVISHEIGRVLEKEVTNND